MRSTEVEVPSITGLDANIESLINGKLDGTKNSVISVDSRSRISDGESKIDVSSTSIIEEVVEASINDVSGCIIVMVSSSVTVSVCGIVVRSMVAGERLMD